MEPFHATPYPAIVNIVFVLPIHVIPSSDVAIVCVVPSPTATNRSNCGDHATPYPAVENTVFPLPVHAIPSGDVAIVFVAP